MQESFQTDSEYGPHSYYRDSAGEAIAYASLQDTIECDVCVIGGGFTGVSAALNLAEAGYKVALLEAERIGWGASGRNGGQASTGFAKDMVHIARTLGDAHARQLWQMSLEATAIIQQRIIRHGIDAEYRPGHLQAATKASHLPSLEAEYDYVTKIMGYDQLQRLSKANLPNVINSTRFQGGLLDMGSGHLHPLKYVRGLADAAAQAGARIFELSRAVRIDTAAPSRPVVHTETALVRARHVVVCCNAYIGKLHAHIRARIMPVGTYIIATEPLGENRALALLPGNACVSDTNFVLDYFRLSGDWRMLFGGRVSYTTVPPPGLAQRMRKRMLATFPSLYDIAITHAWGGFVDISLNRLPDFGRLPGNIYYAQGFSGQGVALSGLAGKLMADAIRGDAEKFDIFSRIPHRAFPGGPLLRMPLLTLGTLYSRLRDFI